jgi:hypothetical protein
VMDHDCRSSLHANRKVAGLPWFSVSKERRLIRCGYRQPQTILFRRSKLSRGEKGQAGVSYRGKRMALSLRRVNHSMPPSLNGFTRATTVRRYGPAFRPNGMGRNECPQRKKYWSTSEAWQERTWTPPRGTFAGRLVKFGHRTASASRSNSDGLTSIQRRVGCDN